MSAFVLLLAASLLTACATGNESTYSYQPPDGYVPDAATAKRIAEAIWLPVYGKKVIDKGRPFQARLSENGRYWIVEGNWNFPGDEGGVALIYISKRSGEILRLSHGQ